MEIVITAPTEKQVNAIYAEVRSVFTGSHISTFTDTFYAVQYIVNHEVWQLYADAGLRRPFSIANFVKLIRTHRHSAHITIVSSNAKDKDGALAAGANCFTDYEKLAEVLAAFKTDGRQSDISSEAL